MNTAIAERRLRQQRLSQTVRRPAADVVAWLGAVQAQEYRAAKWALALRMPDGTVDADIEDAFERGRILRTHVMRPTWHFVTPADIRWMLHLTAARVHRVISGYTRQQGLDAATLVRGARIFERSLRDHQCLTRADLGARLRRAGLAAQGPRLGLITMYAELEGVICSGPRRGKQFTYALLEERAPAAARLSRDEALGALVQRYFRSHGPATIRDFVWWSGLTAADAKRGLEINRAKQETADDRTYWTIGRAPAITPVRSTVHLLPIYDEYLNAYRDRVAVPHLSGPLGLGSRGSGFTNALVIDGQVAGTWRTRRGADAVTLDLAPQRPLTRAEQRALAASAARYGRFLGIPLSLVVDAPDAQSSGADPRAQRSIR